MKQALAVFLLLAGSIVSYGQASYATVTGTVTDPNGNPYAFARLSATLVSSTGVSLKYVYFADGSRYVIPPVNATLGSDGAFSVSVLKNSSVSNPTGTKWQFTVSDPANPGVILAYSPAWSITYSAAITANVSLTTPLSTQAAAVYYANLQTGQNSLQSAVKDSATDPTGVACTSAAPILRYTAAGTSTMYACTGTGGTVYAAIGSGGAAAPSVTVSTSGPVAVTTAGYYFNNAAGALTFILKTLASGDVGNTWCFRNSTTKTGAITLTAPALTFIDVLGANGTAAGTLVSAGAAGDSVCLVAITTTQYMAYVGAGTWTNN